VCHVLVNGSQRLPLGLFDRMKVRRKMQGRCPPFRTCRLGLLYLPESTCYAYKAFCAGSSLTQDDCCFSGPIAEAPSAIMDVVQAGETVLFRLNDDTTFFSVVDSKTYVTLAILAPSSARI
jgi:hypothetical protein